MPSSARFAAFARFQVRSAVALLVPAAAALSFALAAQPAFAGPADAGRSVVTAEGAVTPGAVPPAEETDDSDNGFSWG